MIWITVPAAPGTSPILWKQRIGDFSGKKNVIFMGKKWRFYGNNKYLLKKMGY